MARDPGSLWLPLPEAGTPDGYAKNKLIVHSTGDNGTAAAVRRYFERGDVVVESTFIVGTGPDDPTLQLMDSTDKADANVAANRTGISIEVVGDGVGGYNAWQRTELVRLGRWALANHPIPPQIIPDPDGGGCGWHVQFGAPGPWTTVAKVCPGAARIAELKGVIFPAIFGKSSLPKSTLPPQPAGRPVLREGSTGTIVRELQQALATGYPAYRHTLGALRVDGDFGPHTEAWVQEFQRRSGLAADGVVGPKTWRALGLG